ncbi:MAG: DUF342 domain-containing protein, partial [Methylococcaceae bacterium]|nr:DUF342 domain-containing protein [Methylococcaceae bacterium]
MKANNGLSFKLSSNRTKLLAIVILPCEDKLELTRDIVQQHIKATPYSNFFINEDVIAELILDYNKIQTGEFEFEFEIGERRDAECNISFTDNKMNAYLKLTPNFGGKPVTLDDIQKILDDAEVSFGIVSIESIQEALKKGHFKYFLVAQGIEPIPGVDTKFLSLIPLEPVRQPLVNSEGVVNYRELGNIMAVHKGDVLMQRSPSIDGKSGLNVLGEVIPPRDGLDILFSNDQRGIYVNPENHNQLLAAISGQPVIVPNGIIVSPILTLKNIDLSTGNIRFDGSIVVLGNVAAGMKVYALEDITIGGEVLDSQIECNGHLTVEGCVIGNCELAGWGGISIKGGLKGYKPKHGNAEYKGPEKRKKVVSFAPSGERRTIYPTRVVSRGSVHASFVEHFSIEAGIDIVIDRYSLNNYLTASNTIIVGSKKSSGSKSFIAGGITWAMIYVKAIAIGSTSGIKTVVQVGSNPYIQKRISALKNILLQNEDEQERICAILVWLEKNPDKNNDPQTVVRLNHTLSKLLIGTELYQTELQELLENIVGIDSAKIHAERYVYTGTELKINSAIWQADENKGKSTFSASRNNMSV